MPLTAETTNFSFGPSLINSTTTTFI